MEVEHCKTFDVGIGDGDVREYKKYWQISRKLGRISDYKKKYEDLRTSFDALQKQHKQLARIHASCSSPKKRHEVTKLVLSDDFEIPEVQIPKLLHPERKGHRHWTREDMIQAFSIKSLSSKAYR